MLDPGTSPCSEAPAQARKTASRIEGVKRDRVRWELFNAARRRRFFCEKIDWLSKELPSIAEVDKSEGCSICSWFSIDPGARLLNGSMGVSSSTEPSEATADLGSAPGSRSGTHKRNDNLWMIAGTSSINKYLN